MTPLFPFNWSLLFLVAALYIFLSSVRSKTFIRTSGYNLHCTGLSGIDLSTCSQASSPTTHSIWRGSIQYLLLQKKPTVSLKAHKKLYSIHRIVDFLSEVATNSPYPNPTLTILASMQYIYFKIHTDQTHFHWFIFEASQLLHKERFIRA